MLIKEKVSKEVTKKLPFKKVYFKKKNGQASTSPPW